MSFEEKLSEAKNFASQVHKGQTHKGKPYIEHLDQVSEVLSDFGYHPNKKSTLSEKEAEELQVSAYLHEVLEDTPIDRYTLSKMFGNKVEELVYAVTDGYGMSRKEKKQIVYDKIKKVGKLALILKLADRIANIKFSSSRGVYRLYKKEEKDFKKALYTPGICEEMWDYLNQILLEKEINFPY